MQLLITALLLAALDVDGDGAPDTVEVGGGKVRVVVAGRAAEAAWDGGGSATVEDAGGHRLLVVRGERQTFVGEWRSGTLHTVWSGALGPQGVDGEWARALELGAEGVLLYDTRDDVRLCSGQPARIYPRRFDFGLGRFRAVSLVALPDGATPLVATRGAPAGLSDDTPATVFRFEAATATADDGGSAEGLSAPRELDDGKRETAWSEAQGGFGRGATFVARAETARARVVALRVIPGDASSPAAFQDANRLRRLVVTAAGRAFTVELPEDPARRAPGRPWWIALPEPLATGCVDVVVESVFGSATGRTAISELAVLTDVDAGGGALDALAGLVAAGGADAADAEHTLVRQGARGAAALLAATRAAGRSDAELGRLRRALARGGDPAAAPEIAAGLAAAGSPAEAALLGDALAAMGDAGTAPLARLVADDTAAGVARAEAARALGRLPSPAARDALLAVAGRGDAALRRALILALAARPPADCAALLAAAEGGAHPDVWRAAGLLARHAPAALRDAVVAAASARLAAATGALRYRLVQGLATLGALSAAALAAEPDPALRAVAIDALPAEATRWFVAAVDDPDPGVRAAAASRLAAAPDAGGEPPLLARLAGDRWPRVRRAAADALAVRCAKPGAADGLYGAARGDADEPVRRAALAGLVRCKEPRVGRELVAIAGDHRASPSLRAYAATLAGNVGDRALVPGLIEVFAAARADALAAPDPITADDPQRVAAAAAHALGALDDARAVPLLLETAGDPTLPLVQASALGALATRCPPQTRAVAQRAVRGGDALVARAARLTLTRCGLQDSASP